MEVGAKVESVLRRADPLRHLKAHEHGKAAAAFGSGGFGAAAENAARFFGTPGYIVGQTIVVALWIAGNTAALLNLVHFDRYPYILLNLAFSSQAAYAAPLILLAQTRHADRDKIHAEADAQHREQIAQEQVERSAEIKTLLDQNTELTKKVDPLTTEIHKATCPPTELTRQHGKRERASGNTTAVLIAPARRLPPDTGRGRFPRTRFRRSVAIDTGTRNTRPPRPGYEARSDLASARA